MLSRGWVAIMVVVVLLVASTAYSQTLERPSLSPDRASILVNVAREHRPPASTLERPAVWAVVARDSTDPVGMRIAVASVRATEYYAASGQLRLTFDRHLGQGVKEVDVFLLTATPSRVTWKPHKDAPALGIYSVEKRDKSDVYLGGSWTGILDRDPHYSLDLAAATPGWAPSQSVPTAVSLKGALKSADRTDLDADAYSVAGHVGLLFPIALGKHTYFDTQWDVVRLEYSRKDKASNVVTAPTLVLSRALYASVRDDLTPRAAVDLDISLGVELGSNQESEIAGAGYGRIRRLVSGAVLSLALPGAFGLEEVCWTSTYCVRALGSPEPLIDTRDTPPTVSLNEAPRQAWTDELTLKVTPVVALSFKHEYGAVPPAFKLLDHRVTIGITFMWAWQNPKASSR